MKRHILPFALFTLLCLPVKAQQDTLYLDAEGNHVKNREKAVECALIQKKEDKKLFVNFYTLDGKLTRISQYRQFGKSWWNKVLHGSTHYKFHNSDQDSLTVSYVNNRRIGGAVFYYPNGATMANAQYKDGRLNGLLIQTYENGKLKRKEVYKDNVSQGGYYLSPDSTQLEYTPFYKGSRYIGDDNELVRLTAKYIDIPSELIKYMADSKTYKLTADVGIVIDTQGKAKELVLLRTDHYKFNKDSFLKLFSVLTEKQFISGEIDGKPVNSMILIPASCRISPSTMSPR